VKKKSLYEEFYSRQLVLSELGRKGQKKLARSRVAIVGVGGLGTPSSLYLALAGVGCIRLIDQDVVELRNLHRQILFVVDEIGYPKVEVATAKLHKANSLVKVEAVAENLNAGNAEKLLSGVDCVVDGLDNMRTRYLVNRVCAKNRVPYVFGAAVGIEGCVSVFCPPETPCLECVFPDVRDEDLESCDVRGVLGATAGAVGTLQALETIKVLTGMGVGLKGKLLICDFSEMYFGSVDLLRREDCPTCRGPLAKKEKERLVWLCGRDTANINPEKLLNLDLGNVYSSIKSTLNVRLKSRFALMFDFDGHEVSLFSTGRMLINNVKDERSALTVYERVKDKIGMG
jgi:molybdopterin/thiamine biosynthesis adenylyltransferase